MSGPITTATQPATLFDRIHAAAFSVDGATLHYAVGAEHCEIRSLGLEARKAETTTKLSFCPDRLSALADGSLLAVSSERSAWIAADGARIGEGRTILAALDASHLLERTGTGLVWLSGETSVQLEITDLRSPRIAAGGVVLGIEAGPEGERLVRFDGARPTPITAYFEAIDSWDVAPKGDELAFSAKVESGFDIGIVSTTGGEINWVAPEPADEKNVTWAPRGSKITYTFESLDATLVRSVHVPTSFQVIFDLPLTTVRQIAWEPRAERFAVVIDSPAGGPRIDWVGYQGEDREPLVEAETRVEATVEARYWDGGSGVLLAPKTVRYGEKRTTTVWIAEDEPFAFRPEVARLAREGLPVLVTRPSRVGKLEEALRELPWFIASRLYVVDTTGRMASLDGDLGRAVRLTRGAGEEGKGVVLPADEARFPAAAADVILRRAGDGR